MRKKQKINIIKIWSDGVSRKNLQKIILDVKKWKEKTWEKCIFISSWAVKLWKERVNSFWRNEKDFLKSSLASIWQKFLMKLYWEYLWKNEIIWEILIDDYADEKHLSKTLENLLQNDIWIIINHNDTLHSDELDNVGDKTDNDKNTIYVSKLLQKYSKNIKIKRVVYLTNTDGLLNKYGEVVLWWKIYLNNLSKEKNKYLKYIKVNKSNNGTWWMWSKIICAFKVLEYWIKESIISNAKYWLECLENRNKGYTKFTT